MNTKRISVVIALIVTSTSPITFGDPSPFPNTHSSIETPLSSEIREINSGEAVISEKFTTNSRRHPSFSALNREIGRPDVQQVQLSPGTGRHFQKIRVQAVVHAYRTESSLWLAYPDEDRQFLNEIRNAGIVAPDDQAINVAHKVVNLVFEDGAPADGQAVYQVVREFGVYDNHIAAFVNAAIRAYGNN